MAIAFYCLSTLDVTGIAERQISPTDRKSWKEWIWDQYAGKKYYRRILGFLFLFFPVLTFCSLGALDVPYIIEGGFHPGPFVSVSGGDNTAHVRPIPPTPPPCARVFAPRFQLPRAP